MPRWLPRALKRIRELAAERRVSFTLKARREMAALEPGLNEEDACGVLTRLEMGESAGRQMSDSTGEWMYLFKPHVSGEVLDIKVILRNGCIVVSFHEDEEDGRDDEQ